MPWFKESPKMLAITTIIATNIFQEDKDTENRVEEEVIKN